MDKPIFDERFAVPIGDEQFIGGTKELYDSGKTPALRHIVKSAQRYGTRSKIHKTPEASVGSSEGGLPYPIRPSIFYTADDPSIGGQQSRSTNPTQGKEQTSPFQQRRTADQTSQSSGRASHLTKLVNPPDESVLDLVNPLSLPRRAPSLHQTPVRPMPEGFSLTAPERKKKGKVSSLRETSNQDTEDSQSEERDKLNPCRLTYGELSEEDELDNFEYLELTESDEYIEILRPGTSKSHVTQTKDNTVQTQDPEVDKKGQESQNSGNQQETGDSVEMDRETVSEQESDKESEPESDRESEQESEPKLNKSLSEEEPIPSSESDNDGEMAQPPTPPTAERGPSIRLPWFTGKEDEQVENTLGN